MTDRLEIITRIACQLLQNNPEYGSAPKWLAQDSAEIADRLLNIQDAITNPDMINPPDSKATILVDKPMWIPSDQITIRNHNGKIEEFKVITVRWHPINEDFIYYIRNITGTDKFDILEADLIDRLCGPTYEPIQNETSVEVFSSAYKIRPAQYTGKIMYSHWDQAESEFKYALLSDEGLKIANISEKFIVVKSNF